MIGMGHGLESWGSTSDRVRDFSLLQRIQTGSGSYAASYSVSTEGSFSGGKEAWAWS
jgi:hypothetical protein